MVRKLNEMIEEQELKLDGNNMNLLVINGVRLYKLIVKHSYGRNVAKQFAVTMQYWLKIKWKMFAKYSVNFPKRNSERILDFFVI